MRDTTRKGSPSRVAALTRSGGGVRAVRLASCAVLRAAAAGAQASSDGRIDAPPVPMKLGTTARPARLGADPIEEATDDGIQDRI